MTPEFKTFLPPKTALLEKRESLAPKWKTSAKLLLERLSFTHFSELLQIDDSLLELGHGFCFEARQKRIIIGGEYFFVDLVFYHRILKCHVLIELMRVARIDIGVLMA